MQRITAQPGASQDLFLHQANAFSLDDSLQHDENVGDDDLGSHHTENFYVEARLDGGRSGTFTNQQRGSFDTGINTAAILAINDAVKFVDQ